MFQFTSALQCLAQPRFQTVLKLNVIHNYPTLTEYVFEVKLIRLLFPLSSQQVGPHVEEACC